MLPAGWTRKPLVAGERVYRRITHDDQGASKDLTQEQSRVWRELWLVGSQVPQDHGVPLSEVVQRCRAYCETWKESFPGSAGVEEALKELEKARLVKSETAI